MADEQAQVAQKGKTTTVQFKIPPADGVVDDKAGSVGKTDATTVDAGAAGAGGSSDNGNGTTKDKSVDLSEDQKKHFFKSVFGLDYNGDEDIEKIKEKLKPPVVEKTAEEKAKIEQEREVKAINLFVEGGGTVEQFNLLKEISKADPKEFSIKNIIADTIAAGFSKEEAEQIAKERYYQIELDKLEQDFNETDEDFEKRKASLQKKMEYGSKKLESHSSYQQKKAEDILKQLYTALDNEELQRQSEEKLASNVDAILKDFPRKQTYELGKANEQVIAPIEHEVSEESIKKVAEVLKDPTKRNNIFYNQDGSLNITNLTQLLVNNYELQRVAKIALLEGQDRSAAVFRKTFPESSPHNLGIGGSKANAGGSSSVVTRGKRQVIRPNQNN